MENEKYETGKFEKMLLKSEPYLKLGLAGVFGFLGVEAYDNLNDAKDKFEALPYKNEIVRYNEISDELETPITINDLFDDESKEYFSELITERDSIASLEGFNESRKEYRDFTNKDASMTVTPLFLGVLALGFGKSGVKDLLDKKYKNKGDDK